MLKVSPYDFLLRQGLVFPLLELPILTTSSAEHMNAASLPLSVMMQENNEHLSSCVEAAFQTLFITTENR